MMVPWAVNFANVERAKAELSIAEPVYVAIEAVRAWDWSYGWYSCDNNRLEHHVTLNSYRMRSPGRLSRVLWHELQHASDAERVGMAEWHRVYETDPEHWERAARAAEDNHARLPLVVRLDA